MLSIMLALASAWIVSMLSIMLALASACNASMCSIMLALASACIASMHSIMLALASACIVSMHSSMLGAGVSSACTPDMLCAVLLIRDASCHGQTVQPHLIGLHKVKVKDDPRIEMSYFRCEGRSEDRNVLFSLSMLFLSVLTTSVGGRRERLSRVVAAHLKERQVASILQVKHCSLQCSPLQRLCLSVN